jgi:AcrR family transcriptional regulator
MSQAELRPDGRSERALRQREERRGAILDAALEVFAARGYHHASITDLVEAAGVARGTFYLYFQSKQEVFAALLDAMLLRFRGTIRGVDTSPGASSLETQLIDRVTGMLEAVEAARPVAKILFREANALEAGLQGHARAIEDALHGYLQASLDNGVRLGMIRALDTGVAATAMYGSVRQMIDRYLLNGDPATEPAPARPDLPRLAEEMVRLALHGLRA